jgi:hypothetical protein
MTTPKRCIASYAILSKLVVLVWGASAWAAELPQCPAHPQLSPAADAAFQGGLTAASINKAGADQLAVDYFNRAYDKEPGNEAVWCHLGVAHAKAGNEVPAFTFLEAYRETLDVNTSDPALRNALRSLIRQMVVRNEAKFKQAFLAATLIVDGLPANSRADVAGTVVMQMLAGLQTESAEALARRYPAGMTNTIVTAALERGQELPHNAVVAAMFQVAEVTAMMEPADEDLTDPTGWRPDRALRVPPFPYPKDPAEQRAYIDKWLAEDKQRIKQELDQLLPLWRANCQATWLLNLAIRAASAGLGGTALRLWNHGSAIVKDDSRVELPAKGGSDRCAPWPYGTHKFAIAPDREPIVYLEKPYDKAALQFPEKDQFLSGIWGDDYGGPRFWSTLPQSPVMSCERQPSRTVICPLPVDLFHDRAFVRWSDLAAEANSRPDSPATAIALAEAASKLAIADGLWRNK